MGAMQRFHRRNLRSPLWVPLLIFFLPMLPILIHWIMTPIRPMLYEIPADMVTDPVWIEGSPWPPSAPSDALLVHSIWGTRIVEDGDALWKRIGLPATPMPSSTNMRAIFVEPDEFAAALPKNVNWKPMYLSALGKTYDNRVIPVWLPISETAAPIEDPTTVVLRSRSYGWGSPGEMIVLLALGSTSALSGDFQFRFTVRDAIAGGRLDVKRTTGGGPVALDRDQPYFWILEAESPSRTQRPRLLCFEFRQTNSAAPNARFESLPLLARIAIRLPQMDSTASIQKLPTDHADILGSGSNLSAVLGSNINGVSWDKSLRLRHSFPTGLPVRDQLASFFEWNPSAEIIHSSGGIAIKSAGTTFRHEHPIIGLLLGAGTPKGTSTRIRNVLLVVWALWFLIRTRYFMFDLRQKGYTSASYFGILLLYLQFGKWLKFLPPADEAAILPGVDPGSWQSLRQVVRARLGVG